MDLDKLKGYCLDIGCGGNKQHGFTGMDKRSLPGVDIVHDLEVFPYPLEDESCITIVGSHIVEHVKPWLMLDLMNELWRIMKPGGRLALSMPYGVSPGFIQDPTHCNPCNENTWKYFDPKYEVLYSIYHPKPWKILEGFPVWQVTGNMEVLMEKVVADES
jgi:SAM-dependent methyltransferase